MKTVQWILWVLRMSLVFGLLTTLCIVGSAFLTNYSYPPQPCWAFSSSLGHHASLSTSILRGCSLYRKPFTNLFCFDLSRCFPGITSSRKLSWSHPLKSIRSLLWVPQPLIPFSSALSSLFKYLSLPSAKEALGARVLWLWTDGLASHRPHFCGPLTFGKTWVMCQGWGCISGTCFTPTLYAEPYL